jgi:hypothetical protein
MFAKRKYLRGQPAILPAQCDAEAMHKSVAELQSPVVMETQPTLQYLLS